MVIEPRFLRNPAVCLLSIPRHGDKHDIVENGLLPYPFRDLIDPMREAVIRADLDQLLAKIQEIEARDPQVAQGLRRLAEGFQYQKLLDLFIVESPH